MKDEVKIRCNQCDGVGVHVQPKLTSVFHALRYGSLTTPQVAERCAISSTSAANYLAELYRLGFVTRSGSGKGLGGPYEWARAPDWRERQGTAATKDRGQVDLREVNCRPRR